jgi:hypothetical protein
MTESNVPAASNTLVWVGRIISGLIVALMTMSAVMKFIKSEDAIKGFTDLGWSADLALALGIVELACTILYATPQTAVLGAILLTGYMGGAIATHVRINEMFIVQTLIGVLAWLALYLREPRLRALIPLRP